MFLILQFRELTALNISIVSFERLILREIFLCDDVKNVFVNAATSSKFECMKGWIVFVVDRLLIRLVSYDKLLVQV